VGRRSDAIKLHAIRKADVLRGMKLPANVKDKGIKFKVIAQEAIEWYVNHERNLPSFDIASNTGMRKQEQFSLEWLQVSFCRRRIHLTMTKNGSTRKIPMNWTCQQSFEVLQALGRHEGRIFQSKYGKELNNPRKWFELALEEVEIKNFRWHDLRNTFISRLMIGREP
jgi:integrase